MTFALVVLAALLAVFPATAAFGFLLCLLALVPAVLAHRRARRGTATNRRRSFAAVLMAPAFLVVALVVGASTASAQVESASDTTALRDAPSPAAASAPVAPLVAAPAETPAADLVTPVDDQSSSTTTPAAPKASTRTSTSTVTRPPARAPERAAATAPARSGTAARVAAPAPVAKPAPSKPASSKPAPSKPAPTTSSKPPPPAAASSPVCDEDTHYVNSKGNCVLRPVAAASAPDGATAKCKNGEYSFSQSRSGTCSRNGGVAEWL